MTSLPDGMILKMRLIPWIRTPIGYVWLASLAVGKSKRQINDWMNQRKKKSVSRLSSNLTGKFGSRTQAIAIRQVRQWVDELPAGDMIALRCESALPDKQFRVWKKWFAKHEDIRWEIKEEFKAFWFYKSSPIE